MGNDVLSHPFFGNITGIDSKSTMFLYTLMYKEKLVDIGISYTPHTNQLSRNLHHFKRDIKKLIYNSGSLQIREIPFQPSKQGNNK